MVDRDLRTEPNGLRTRLERNRRKPARRAEGETGKPRTGQAKACGSGAEGEVGNPRTGQAESLQERGGRRGRKPSNRAGEGLQGRGGRRNGRHRIERNDTPRKRHLNASSGEHDFPVLNPIEGLRRAVRRSGSGNRTPDRRTQRNERGKPQETSDDDELETDGNGGRRRG